MGKIETAFSNLASTAEVGHYINGKVQAGASGRYGDVYNPATGELARKVALANEAEVDAAVRAANAAFPAWADQGRDRRTVHVPCQGLTGRRATSAGCATDPKPLLCKKLTDTLYL